MSYIGSCHCGQTKFEVASESEHVIECNCSYCSRKGLLLWFVPREQLKLKTSEDELTTYTFNKHIIQHRICPTCGCQPFATAPDRTGQMTAAINVRCLEDVELDKVQRVPFDGRSL